MLTKPLADHMDHLSLLETAQKRERLQTQGILSEDSKCIQTVEHLVDYNLAVVTGSARKDVISNFFQLLHSPPDDFWVTEFDLKREDSFSFIVSAMCDTWRRMVLPFEGSPWQVFKAVHMDEHEGISFLQKIGLDCCSCERCEDKFFTKVSWLVD